MWSAYLSASNMFRKSAFPATIRKTKKIWPVDARRPPLFYAGLTKSGLDISWERRLADSRKPRLAAPIS